MRARAVNINPRNMETIVSMNGFLQHNHTMLDRGFIFALLMRRITGRDE
jgi:hypothetical protein